jgi:hypothetical protein
MIGGLIREIPTAYRRDIIIADGGSAGATHAVARAAAARVVDARLIRTIVSFHSSCIGATRTFLLASDDYDDQTLILDV